jgi:hypothetical protein
VGFGWGVLAEASRLTGFGGVEDGFQGLEVYYHAMVCSWREDGGIEAVSWWWSWAVSRLLGNSAHVLHG